MSDNHQTQSYLMRRFDQVGIRPKTRFGQNFLIDLNLLRLLFESAQIDDRDVVLEVGTGVGSLTALLASQAAHVVTVEVDSQLHQLASEELIDCENVTLLKQDALKNKNHLHPVVLDALRERLAGFPERRLKLAANLPFNVATPIVSNLLSCGLEPYSMTVTIQKELADRMMARPSTKDYSALSVWVQSQCEAELVRIMPPAVFWPRPKVHSAILNLRVRDDWRRAIPDAEFFHTFVRSLFFHRRKFLRSVLQSAFKDRLARQDVDDVLHELGFGETARAEELDIQTMLAMSEAFRQRVLATAPPE